MSFRSVLKAIADIIKAEPVVVATATTAFLAWLVSTFGLSADTTTLIRSIIVALLAIVARYAVTPVANTISTDEYLNVVLQEIGSNVEEAKSSVEDLKAFHAADLGKTDSTGFNPDFFVTAPTRSPQGSSAPEPLS